MVISWLVRVMHDAMRRRSTEAISIASEHPPTYSRGASAAPRLYYEGNDDSLASARYTSNKKKENHVTHILLDYHKP